MKGHFTFQYKWKDEYRSWLATLANETAALKHAACCLLNHFLSSCITQYFSNWMVGTTASYSSDTDFEFRYGDFLS